jgi:hypothetical protein
MIVGKANVYIQTQTHTHTHTQTHTHIHTHIYIYIYIYIFKYWVSLMFVEKWVSYSLCTEQILPFSGQASWGK